MVRNLRAFERKMNVSIPQAVDRHLRQQMAVGADKVVATAEAFVSERYGDLKNSIGWVWGTNIPKGAIAIGSVTSGGDDDLLITIFAGNDDAFYARWVEFGTKPHSLSGGSDSSRGKKQDGGAQHPGASAHPFFFPAYRLNKRSIKSGMTRAIKKGLKEGSR